MNTFNAMSIEQSTVFWQIVSDVLIVSAVVVILGCALGLALLLVRGGHDVDAPAPPPVPDVVPPPQQRASLDAAVRSPATLSGVRDVRSGNGGLGPARSHGPFPVPAAKGFTQKH